MHHQDNAPAHTSGLTIITIMVSMWLQTLWITHLSYTLDLTPPVFHLFFRMKNKLYGHQCYDNDDVNDTVKGFL